LVFVVSKFGFVFFGAQMGGLFSYPFVIIEVTFILAFLDLGSFWVRLGSFWVRFSQLTKCPIVHNPLLIL
jgi:hypothetical protein